jgi:hypothetical protein
VTHNHIALQIPCLNDPESSIYSLVRVKLNYICVCVCVCVCVQRLMIIKEYHCYQLHTQGNPAWCVVQSAVTNQQLQLQATGCDSSVYIATQLMLPCNIESRYNQLKRLLLLSFKLF